jgi:sugar lactone lactonase YvrE
VAAVFVRGPATFSGLAFAANGNLYAASVATGRIYEYDPNGELVRRILTPPERLPPFSTGSPQGLAVDSEGNVYYADLDLVWGLGGVGPGPDGKIRRIRFDASGEPLPPETLLDGLPFPDGVGIAPAIR